MKRKIYKQLLRWKESKDRKPLMLLGARQVGKTWIMRHFGEHEYKKVAYVNCDDEPRIKQLFELDYDIDRILVTLQAITGVKITSADTLIILDEIQEIPHFFDDKTSYFRYSEKSVRRISPLRRKVSWKARAATIDCGS